MPECHNITGANITVGHKAFVTQETLYLFYDYARTFVKKGWRKNCVHDLALGISVILQTWNKGYYQRSPFDVRHFRRIERLLSENLELLARYRTRSIQSLNEADARNVQSLFRAFEMPLGPVGAAKALHLLAPRFFSLWDGKIAAKYNVALQPRRTNRNGSKYFEFMKCQKVQAEAIGNHFPTEMTVLKAIDEYNYAHFTKGWI